MSTEEIPVRFLGVSGAVNLNTPDETALNHTKKLEGAINNLNIFENADEAKKRREALYELQEFSNKWIYRKALENNYPSTLAATIRGKIFTFGSYRLGVNFSGADIDALLVVPRFISRETFFSDFVKELTENNEHAKDIHPVQNAFVPVVKMIFMDVEIDLLFAKVDQISIPELFSLTENSNQLLRNMDERDVRSVNGVRVTDDILNLVYDKKAFKSVLKIIRIWAKRRCIYSNAMGFLGGVSWAILVARICQLWPKASVSTLVYNFFRFYGEKWRWPMPIILKEIEQNSELNLTQWDPRINPSDQYHVMPIITPSYPSQNSTYNVTESHKNFIVQQMRQALDILRKIFAGNRPYEDLFKPLFFFKFKNNICVTYQTDDRKKFREETSFIESKLRILASNLESNGLIESAVLYLKPFDSEEMVNFEEPIEGKDRSELSQLDEQNDLDSSNVKIIQKMQLVRRWIIGFKLTRALTDDLNLLEEIGRFVNVLGDVLISTCHCYRYEMKTKFIKDEELQQKILAQLRKEKAARNLQKENEEAAASSSKASVEIVKTANEEPIPAKDISDSRNESSLHVNDRKRHLEDTADAAKDSKQPSSKKRQLDAGGDESSSDVQSISREK